MEPLDADTVAAYLEGLLEHPERLVALEPDRRRRLLEAAGRLSRPDKAQKRKRQRAFRKRDAARRRAHDEALLAQTGIRKLRENPLFETPRFRPDATPPPPLGHTEQVRPCYCCRAPITEVHGFYDQLCLACGDLNFAKRHATADLRGRTALLTGGRVKIGFQAGVMLLRAGARLIVTTRFPHDAARRYAALEDAPSFLDRLEIYGLDLRHIHAVEAFTDELLRRLPRLDYLINNACQTVRRPPGFYRHLLEAERDASGTEAALVRRISAAPATPAELSCVPLLPEDHTSAPYFPEGRYDADQQQVDLRERNSWRLEMDEVSTVELAEVHLVNAMAPFILNARLKPLLAAVPTRDAHIVNVSAVEGQFYRIFKTSRHPHTNMAKAALNMMTRTASLDYIRHGIHMNSVDTGWVTDEDPAVHAERKRAEHGFHPPLDIVDGAARVVDPIFHGVNTGEHRWGQFLKDYRPTDW